MSCPECIEKARMLADASDRMLELHEELRVNDETIRMWSNKAAGLQAKLSKIEKAQHVPTELVQAIVDYWNWLCRAGRAKDVPERSKLVQSRFNDLPDKHGNTNSPWDLLEAIDGAFYSPEAVWGFRGATAKRHDSLEEIFKNGSTLEKYRGYFAALPPGFQWSRTPAFERLTDAQAARGVKRLEAMLACKRVVRAAEDEFQARRRAKENPPQSNVMDLPARFVRDRAAA